MSTLLGLDDFGLTLANLRRLRGEVGVRVNLHSFRVTTALIRLPPSERHPYLRRQTSRWVSRLNAAYPGVRWRVIGESRGIPYALEGRIPAAQVAGLATQRGVDAVILTRVPGQRRRLVRAASRSWFCVRALVAIQIEGQRSGLQTVEDRFMVVRATSRDDAERRLRRQWREYARPYINPLGELVRWQLEKVTDLYDVAEDQLDPNGAEVYSKLHNRRLRPSFVWLGGAGRRTRG
jgi:hypothetical protein